jgi:hypothetical protein
MNEHEHLANSLGFLGQVWMKVAANKSREKQLASKHHPDKNSGIETEEVLHWIYFRSAYSHIN